LLGGYVNNTKIFGGRKCQKMGKYGWKWLDCNPPTHNFPTHLFSPKKIL